MAAAVLDVATAIRAGRILATRQAPYFASALHRMLLVETATVPTAAVDDRWRIYVNPGWASTMTVNELAYVWLHEVGHCLRAHQQRWEALADPDHLHTVFNVAGDALINADLDDITDEQPNGRVTFDGLGFRRAHRGMSVEVLYRLLLDTSSAEAGDSAEAREPGPVDCGSGASGGRRPWDLPATASDDGSVDPASAELIRDTVAREVRTQRMGAVPAAVRRWADERLDPVVDWHRELRSVLTKELAQRAGRRDYTYARPSRRQVPGVVLPAMAAAAPPSVAVVIDTSGSMGGADLARAIAETRELTQRVCRDRKALRVLSVDSAAHTATTVRSVRQVELIGGGGTDMRTGIQAAASLHPHPDLVVVITDGLTPWPAAPPRPGLRVVAVLTRDAATTWPVPRWIRTIDSTRGTTHA